MTSPRAIRYRKLALADNEKAQLLRRLADEADRGCESAGLTMRRSSDLAQDIGQCCRVSKVPISGVSGRAACQIGRS
jgi:hypothetical protein